MIPLRDNVPSSTYPVVNRLLVLTSVVAFVATLLESQSGLQATMMTYGLVPAQVTRALRAGAPLGAYLPLITNQFLHANIWHLGGNMLYLWIFGDNVEDAMGHAAFLVFYLLAGVVGNVAQIAVDPAFAGPVIGASGAIAGVLGGYLVLFPRARVLALVPLGFFLTTAQIPVLVFLPLWFLFQLIPGIASPAGGGVAYWAHIGGFAAGFILVRVFARRPRAGSW